MDDLNLVLPSLLGEVRACRVCEVALPWGAKPVLRASSTARVLLVGQAPGTRVHTTGIPWNDASGERLRDWLKVSRSVFYDETRIAILPMGFCYPGKGRAGDNPPRPECAALWRAKLHALLPELRLILLIGAYAIRYYLPKAHCSLAELMLRTDYQNNNLLPLVHPSPRNTLWLRQNSYFEQRVVPIVRRRVHALL